jgi:hypothetical protein
MLNPTVQYVSKPYRISLYLVRLLLIFAISLYLHEAFYGLITEAVSGTGLFGYLIGFELIIFFGHTFALLNWLCIFLFAALHLLGGIFVLGMLAADRFEFRWNVAAFLLAGPVLLSTLVAYEIEAWAEQRDAVAQVSRVNLDVQPSAPVIHSGFIELTGWRDQHDAINYLFAVSGKYRDVISTVDFVPVVAKGWTPASPIRYFARFNGAVTNINNPPEEQTETGKVSGHLPYYVVRQLRARNLKIDPDYAVIQWQQIENHHIVDTQERYMVLGFGLLITVPVAIGACIFYFVAGRQNRQGTELH